MAGKAPTVTFTVKDNAGNGLTMAQMTGGNNRIGLVLAGPTTDYGYTSFGTDVTTQGYVSENPVPTAKCSSDGTCTYTFTHAIPADANGTFAIGIEARREHHDPAGHHQGSRPPNTAPSTRCCTSRSTAPRWQPRRKVVDIAKCNGCHSHPVAARRKPQPDRAVRPLPQPERERWRPPRGRH